jgi:hypothetical protein
MISSEVCAKCPSKLHRLLWCQLNGVLVDQEEIIFIYGARSPVTLRYHSQRAQSEIAFAKKQLFRQHHPLTFLDHVHKLST